MKINVVYEEKLQIETQKAFDLTIQWLSGQYKSKIKISNPPLFIEAKQGTMMTNTGHDPNWKKRIMINFYTLESNQTLIRVKAIPLARNIFNVDKLKQSWYIGLFCHLFSLLQTVGPSLKQEVPGKPNVIQGIKLKYCKYCGNRIEETAIICPTCGINIE